VHRDRIAQAVKSLKCPVQANGGIDSAAGALAMLDETGAAGLMVGRGAIRNPWVFSQIRDALAGRTVVLPTGREVLSYIEELYSAVCLPDFPERMQVHKMKKYMNFLGEGLEDAASFLHDIRRCDSRSGFFSVCVAHLDHDRPLMLDAPAG
jgi:tRNA-dihydrouridine synthase